MRGVSTHFLLRESHERADFFRDFFRPPVLVRARRSHRNWARVAYRNGAYRCVMKTDLDRGPSHALCSPLASSGILAATSGFCRSPSGLGHYSPLVGQPPPAKKTVRVYGGPGGHRSGISHRTSPDRFPPPNSDSWAALRLRASPPYPPKSWLKKSSSTSGRPLPERQRATASAIQNIGEGTTGFGQNHRRQAGRKGWRPGHCRSAKTFEYEFFLDSFRCPKTVFFPRAVRPSWFTQRSANERKSRMAVFGRVRLALAR